MTDLYNGQITDLLNNAYRYDPEVIAFSYAILQEKRRIMQELAQTRTMSVIDDLPESILDVLAVELRTPYYVDSLSVDAKREIIKKSFLWAARAGTVSAVEELVRTVFGESGEVVEWFKYDGIPGKWQLKIDISQCPDLLDRSLDKIKQLLKLVGRCSAHLETIIYAYTLQHPLLVYASAAFCSTSIACTVRLPGMIQPQAVGATAYTTGAAASARMMAKVEIPGIITPKSVSAQAYAAGRLAHTHETVTITIGG